MYRYLNLPRGGGALWLPFLDAYIPTYICTYVGTCIKYLCKVSTPSTIR